MAYIVINSSILGIRGKKPLNYVKGKSFWSIFGICMFVSMTTKRRFKVETFSLFPFELS